MSDEKTLEQKDVTAATEDDKNMSEKTVPLAALAEERGRRRELEAKLKTFEEADRKKQEEDLSWKNKFEKRDTEYNTLKEDTKKSALRSAATERLLSEGFPKKLIDPVIKSADLTEDNLDKTVKSIAKDFEEFKTKQNNVPSLLHPSSVQHESVRTQADALRGAVNEIFNKQH